MKILAYATNEAVITEKDAKVLTHINAAFVKLKKDGTIDAGNLAIIKKFSEIRG